MELMSLNGEIQDNLKDISEEIDSEDEKLKSPKLLKVDKHQQIKHTEIPNILGRVGWYWRRKRLSKIEK